ncbi:transketolase [Clostridiaceae bacterium]|nr:transketolase [Clostridiaceae bacterium]
MKTRVELESIAKNMRKDIFKMALNSGTKGAHLGGSLSAVELLTVLYGEILKYDVQTPKWEDRDRFILSKAHSAIGLYAALKYAGFLTEEDIEGALHNDSFLYKHPRYDLSHGFEFSGGSLGQGLSLGVGTALALKLRQNKKAKVYVLLGDGECDEGSVWEAAASVIHFDLKQITVMIDQNRLQNDGTTEQVMKLGNMAERWASIGFDVIEADGHDVLEIRKACLMDTKNPKVILAHTVKGKGVSFAENVVDWHISYFTKEMFDQAMEELG